MKLGPAPHPSFAEVEHRPWPLPRNSWALTMVWEELLFAHWPVRPKMLADLIPAGLDLETFDGDAWLGVVPFRMADVRPRFLPPFPTTANFPELNVRTYVRHGERPGVWFFSLDAASRLSVRGARFAFHLPYFDARMTCARDGEAVRYASERTHRGALPAEFRARYAPTGPLEFTRPGTLEHWLTERYCLYAADRRGRLFRADVHHAPWPLQRAEAELETDTMTAQIRVERPGPPALLHFARRLDVAGWLPRPVAPG